MAEQADVGGDTNHATEPEIATRLILSRDLRLLDGSWPMPTVDLRTTLVSHDAGSRHFASTRIACGGAVSRLRTVRSPEVSDKAVTCQKVCQISERPIVASRYLTTLTAFHLDARRLHSAGFHNPSRFQQGPPVTAGGPWSFRACIAGFTTFCVIRDDRNRGTHPSPFRPEKSRTGPRVSKSRDAPPVSPAI